MAMIKCKMCGGDLKIEAGKTVAECEYCGTLQTVPTADNEKKLTLFARANRLRAACEFDKAAGVYENIVAEFPAEAEAYWGLVLCRYGIEYVDDPATGKKIPTCHRSSFESILDDVDFEQAQENADSVSRKLYREEAKTIEDIRRRIMEVSGKEQPYDVFICYKETDENGERTPDSVMAQEVYDELTEKGYRVFFSRITLEDKLGMEYEPYIFAALNSAKVMLVFGTQYDYFNAVWVKNEWSRFLALIAAGEKKTLIPCYKGVDAYDMPKEFVHLQGQDMGKLGAFQDLVRGVEKLLGKSEPAQAVIVQTTGGVSADALLKRGEMALEDGEWVAADEFFDRMLDMNAECAEAYLGKFLAGVKQKDFDAYISAQISGAKEGEAEEPSQLAVDEARIAAAVERFGIPGYLSKMKIRDQFAAPGSYKSVLSYWQREADRSQKRLQEDLDMQKAREFAAGTFRESLEKDIENAARRWSDCIAQAQSRDAQAAQAAREAYAQALEAGERQTEALYKEAVARREEDYCQFCERQKAAKKEWDYRSLSAAFERLGNYRDSAQRAQKCEELGDQAKKLESAAAARREAKEKRLNNRIKLIIIIVVVVIIGAMMLYGFIIQPRNEYKKAEALLAREDHAAAAQVFEGIADYKDAAQRAGDIYYALAQQWEEKGEKYLAAINYARAKNHDDARERSFTLWGEVSNRGTISAGNTHTAALKEDGTVVATGDNRRGQCDVNGWSGIEAIETGDEYTVGLKENGTVVIVGNDYAQQYDAMHWKDIVAISAGSFHVVGLNAEGSVLAVGDNDDGECNVTDWTDIVDISAGEAYTVGLKADGTVVAVGAYSSGQCDVQDWTDIVAVSAGVYHTVGLKADGTVVATGSNQSNQCDVGDWTDIVAISAGKYHTVGLKADGTVVAVGDNDDGQCDVEDWTDIVDISAGGIIDFGLHSNTVGLKADGTLVAVGYNSDGQCDVEDWTGIRHNHRAEEIQAAHYARGEALLSEEDRYGAMAEFMSAGDYKDAQELVVELHYAQGEALRAEGDFSKAIVEFEAAGGYKDAQEIVPALHYAQAETLLAQGDRRGAAEHFKAAGMYEDAEMRAGELYYTLAYESQEAGDLKMAAIYFGSAATYANARSRSLALWDQIAVRETISARGESTIGLKTDGTVVTAGLIYENDNPVENWTDIVAVSDGYFHVVGLKADGTVVDSDIGNNSMCQAEGWKDIVAVSAGGSYTVGLKMDGTVVAVGATEDGICDVEDWRDIISIRAGISHTVGLKADGTVVAVGRNNHGQCNVENWRDIVAISAGEYHTVGLRADGTVVAVGNNDCIQCNTEKWDDIVAISAGECHTVGLHANGATAWVGLNADGQCYIGQWRDVVALSVGSNHTVGLRKDGSVVATGSNRWGQCDVDGWTDILVRP